MNRQPQAVECRSCKALMFWVKTKAGKPMPVDAKPDPRGGLVVNLRHDDEGRPELHAMAYSKDEPTHQNRNRYTSHFVTCPNSREHRRPR